MKVFVTDGNQRSSLAVVRSLGRAGVYVGVGDDQQVTLAGSSKHCAETLVYPSPVSEPKKFQEFLLEELPHRDYQFLLPTTDVTAQLTSALKPILEPRVCVLTEDSETLSRLQDKGALLEVAVRIGIGVPRYVDFDTCDQALRFAEEVGYPVVVKPRRSRLLCNGTWREGSVRYAHTPAQLDEACSSIESQIPSPLVQEMLRGDGRGIFLLMWHGHVKAAFCHRRLREKPPWGGVSVLSESIEPDEALIAKSANLLRELNWNGPAMVEFKNDQYGEPKLMEVNGRFWGTLRLAIESGIDFPMLYLRLCAGEDVPAQTSYRVGVRCRWFLGDLDSLLALLRASKEQKVLFPRCASRLNACAEFLRWGGSALHFDVYESGDYRPACVEWDQYLRQFLNAILQRVQPSGSGA